MNAAPALKPGWRAWVVLAAVIVLIVAGVGLLFSGKYREMETHTGRTRSVFTVLGVTFVSGEGPSEITPLLDGASAAPPEWKTIAGGSMGARTNFVWGQIAVALLNASEWMESEQIPLDQRKAVARELMRLARRDQRLLVGYRDDRFVVHDEAGGVLYECIRPSP